MSYCVPDFELETSGQEDEEFPTFDSRSKKAFSQFRYGGERADDELVELLWQNGQVVTQSQNQRPSFIKKPFTKTQPCEDLFVQEDEMAAWLHYPLDYESFDADFLHDASPSSSKIAPIPEDRRGEEEEKLASPEKPLVSFSKAQKSMQPSQPCTSEKAGRGSTMVDSSETPGRIVPAGCGAAPADAPVACEVTVTSSSGGSEEPSTKRPAEDRKRKAREADYDDCHSEDAGFDSADTKRHARVSTSARRSRAAEVHNLSERRRRDRINEKMKALQELIPRCNKMMSMGSSMMPMGFPGVQQYMSPMLMGMGMGMGMDTALSQPMLPFPSVLTGSSMRTPPAVTHLGPRFPYTSISSTSCVFTDLSTSQQTNQPDTTLNSIRAQSPSLMQVPNFTDPYQHYLGLHQMQVPPCRPRVSMPCQGPFVTEKPAMAQPNKSKGVGSLENNKSTPCS